ncbi:AraC family transcriptional regulator, partial [Mycobacterium sp. ITM-2017-0098]
MQRTVLIVGFAGVQALDIVGPFEVFTGASLFVTGRGGDGYSVRVVSVDGEPVSTGTGLTLVAQPLPGPDEAVDTVVLPGGYGTEAARKNDALMDWIAAVAPRARRVVSVCTGAVLAAQAGLLDGCVATTHWAFAPQMADEFPAVTVNPDP